MPPETVDNPALPFLFYREAAAGNDSLVLDPRVRVERVTEGLRARSSADLTLRFAEDKLADGTVVEPELTDAAIRARYSPVVRCGVAQAPPPGGTVNDLVWLTHGYIEAPQLKFGASGGRRFFNRTMKMRDIFTRWARREDAWVQGRYLLSRAGWEHARDNPAEDPLFMLWSQLGAHVQSLPCIFNPNGRPNRMPRAAYYDVTNGWSLGPTYLFTTDDDPNAEHWTYLQALRYLVLLHLPFGAYSNDAYVSPGLLFSPTLAGPNGSEWWKEDEPDVPLAGAVLNGWREHVTRRCQSLAVEGFDLVEALSQLCTACGIEFAVAHGNAPIAGAAGVLSKLTFWAPGDKSNEHLALEKTATHFDDAGKPREVAEILAHNNVQNCESARELGNAVALAKVLGAADWRTVMVELLPLWPPDPSWDSPDAPLNAGAAALAAAAFDKDVNAFVSIKDSDFYKRFRADGELFGDGANALIGRLWGVDPAGELDAATYNRHAPWDDAFGDPWVIPGEANEAPRRRPIRAIPTIEGHAALGVPLEITFNGDQGAPTWYRLQTQIGILSAQSAIYLKAPDLLVVGAEVLRRESGAGSNIEAWNFYDAYLHGELRLRAVFQVQLDRRLEKKAAAIGFSAVPTQGITALVIRDRDFIHDDDDPGVPAYVFDFIDGNNDKSSALAFAELLIADRAGGRWSGRFTVPWVETVALSLGTPIEGIRRAKDGPVEIPFGGSATSKGRYPTVVQKIYTNSRQSGVATEVVLGDYRFAKHTGPPD